MRPQTRLSKSERRTAYHTCIRNVTHRQARRPQSRTESEGSGAANLRLPEESLHQTLERKDEDKTKRQTSPVTIGKMNGCVFTLQSLRGRQAFRECTRERLQCGVALQPWPRRHLLPAVRPRWQDVPHRP